MPILKDISAPDLFALRHLVSEADELEYFNSPGSEITELEAESLWEGLLALESGYPLPPHPGSTDRRPVVLGEKELAVLRTLVRLVLPRVEVLEESQERLMVSIDRAWDLLAKIEDSLAIASDERTRRASPAQVRKAQEALARSMRLTRRRCRWWNRFPSRFRASRPE